jgi:hypothetical protein
MRVGLERQHIPTKKESNPEPPFAVLDCFAVRALRAGDRAWRDGLYQ